jgi:hypothetical protein
MWRWLLVLILLAASLHATTAAAMRLSLEGTGPPFSRGFGQSGTRGYWLTATR